MDIGQLGLWLLVATFAVVALAPSSTIDKPKSAALLTFGVVGGVLSVLSLIQAFVSEDWANEYVVDHTRSGLAWPIRLAGLWGGAEGSLLLWTVFLAAAALVAVLMGANRRLASILPPLYALVVLRVANPFKQLPAPEPDGLGLQPVLEHPAMAWHPPILYAGLVAMTIPTLLAMSGSGMLPSGAEVAPEQIGRAGLASRLRLSTLAAMALLSAGLATGAGWAHAELGWGGYWAWDPIESAGLVAWLAAGATLHTYRVGAYSVLPLLPGLAAIWATTLTRTGLVNSVHAFADRPALRRSLLGIAFVCTAAIAVAMLQDRGAVDWKKRVTVSGSGLVGKSAGMFVLLVSAALVGLGTYEPAAERLFGGDSIAIAGTYFATVMWPVVICGAFLARAADKSLLPAAVGALFGLLLVPFSAGFFALAVGASGGMVAGAALGSRTNGASRAAGRVAGLIAHVGIGVLLIGVAGTMATRTETVSLTKGEPIVVSGVTATHRGISLVEEPAQDRAVATIELNGTTLEAQLVAHKNRRISTAEVANRRGFLSETQAILRDGTDEVATYTIIHFPRLNLVWAGVVLMVAGFVFGIFERQFVRTFDPVSATLEK